MRKMGKSHKLQIGPAIRYMFVYQVYQMFGEGQMIIIMIIVVIINS